MKKKNKKKNTKFGIGRLLCEVLLISLFVAGSYACLIKYDVIPEPNIKGLTKDIEVTENVNIGVGERFNANVGITSPEKVVWRSIDESVATVENGVIKGEGIGETNVSYEMPDGSKKTIYVYVDNAIGDRANTDSTYVISYNANGGSGNTIESTTCTYGKSCAVSGKLYTRTGYTFVGWTSNSNGTNDGYNWTGWSGTWNFKNGERGIKSNKLVLYAMWDLTSNSSNRYTIEYRANGGTGSIVSHICVKGQKCTIKGNAFTRSGYTFAGFASADSGKAYNWTGWTGTWNFSNGNYGIKNNKLVLYARWKQSDSVTPTKEAFTIKYVSNGGSGSMDNQTCYKGEKCTIKTNTFTRKGYKFIKWRTSSSITVPAYNWTGWTGVWNFSNGQYGINNSTLTLYATWEQSESQDQSKPYTIKYMPNGGSGNTVTQTCTYGKTCTIKPLSTFTRSGYKMIKWRTTSSTSTPAYNWTGWSGTWKFTNGKYGIKNNELVLYATWEGSGGTTKEEFTVYYLANGGTGAQMTTTKCKSGETCTIKNCDYSKSGYKFVGWTTNKDGKDDGYNWTGFSGKWTFKNGEKGITANALKLYARWTKKSSSTEEKFTISYDANGGSGSMDSQTCTSNKTCKIKANKFTRDNYKFVGWTTNKDGKDDGYNWTGWSGTWTYKNGEYGIKNNKLKLYARWKKNSSGGDGGSKLPDKIPSGYSDIGKSYKSNTLYYKVTKKNNTNLYYALIWVEDANKQLNCGNSNYTSQTKPSHFSYEIKNYGYQNKGMIGTNGGFAINGRDNIPVLATRGTLKVNEKYQTKLSDGRGVVYGTLSVDSSGNLISKTSSDANEMKTWLKNNGGRNAWGITHFITSGWKTGGSSDVRTMLCQVDTHNFVLSTGYFSGIETNAKQMHDDFGCKTVVNMDGGGSTGMYFKTSSMSGVNAIYQYKRPSETSYRSVVDILYFGE